MSASIPTRIISTLPSRHAARKALDCNALSQRNRRGQQPLYAPRPVLGRRYCSRDYLAGVGLKFNGQQIKLKPRLRNGRLRSAGRCSSMFFCFFRNFMSGRCDVLACAIYCVARAQEGRTSEKNNQAGESDSEVLAHDTNPSPAAVPVGI